MENKNIMNETTTETTTATETIDLSVYSVEELLEMLNDAETTTQSNTLRKALAERLKAENKESKKLDIQTFAHTAKRDEELFWQNFIETPYANTKRLTQNEVTDEWEVKSGKTRLTFEDIDKAYGEENEGRTIANSKRYVGMIARFTHNLYRATCDGLNDEIDEAVSKVVRVKFKGEGDTKIEEFDFSGNSTTALKDQLNAIIKTIMPEGGAFLMKKADVRYIREGFTKACEGKVTTAREATVSKLIWDAVKVRKSGKPYVVESKAKCHAEKK